VARERTSRHHMASPARRRWAARSARVPSPVEPDSPAGGIIVESRRRTVLFGGWSSQVPSATTGDGQRSTRLGGWAAPDSADEQQRRGSFSGGGRNAKRTPCVSARRRGAPRCCPLLLGGRKRGCSCSTGHARDIDSRAHGICRNLSHRLCVRRGAWLPSNNQKRWIHAVLASLRFPLRPMDLLLRRRRRWRHGPSPSQHRKRTRV